MRHRSIGLQRRTIPVHDSNKSIAWQIVSFCIKVGTSFSLTPAYVEVLIEVFIHARGGDGPKGIRMPL